jgi:hypothetical protein
MTLPTPTRQTRGYQFEIGGLVVTTRPGGHVMLSDPDATHAWIACQDAPHCHDWR